MKQSVTLIICLSLLSACDVSINTNASRALEFLMLLDEGRADLTWLPAGSALKASTSESNWVKGISGLRTGVGEFKHRNHAQISFTREMPDAPPGLYAAVQIQSSFSNLEVVEVVLLVEEDDQWRVVGYNISKNIQLKAAIPLL
ncbi:DUF4019 domain-containing protein [Pseudomonas sp. SWI44]|uniref:DUF4019 domain-containing protein n=1 Tax=Pseudomonas sp. SWI44 TaxID=2083053 RepID=UPI00131A2196|nr:DUF4019 domain-containing protein [Pseudomonas sp. SWI44]